MDEICFWCNNLNNGESSICCFVIWHLERMTAFSIQIKLYSYHYARFCSYFEWLPRRKCSLYFSQFHQLKNLQFVRNLMSFIGSRNKLNSSYWKMTRKENMFLIVFVSLVYKASFNSLFLYSPLTNFLCSLWNNWGQKKGKEWHILK